MFFRDEIAGCIEKAYHRIGLSEAARMLFFESQKPMRDYAAQVISFGHSASLFMVVQQPACFELSHAAVGLMKKPPTLKYL